MRLWRERYKEYVLEEGQEKRKFNRQAERDKSMSEKSSFGKNSRNEGYRPNRQYSKSQDGESRPADFRGKRSRQQDERSYTGAGAQDNHGFRRGKTKDSEVYGGEKTRDKESYGKGRPKYGNNFGTGKPLHGDGLARSKPKSGEGYAGGRQQDNNDFSKARKQQDKDYSRKGKIDPGKNFNRDVIDRNNIDFETENQNKELQGDLDKLEGRNSVLEALKAGRSINRIFVAKGDRDGSIGQIIAIARQNHILIQEIDRTKLDNMSVTHSHQGVIALSAAKDYIEVDDILEMAVASGRPPFIIILDEITDAYNLGSILRTANAAGVHGVIIPKRRAIGLTSAVSKASAGAIEYVPVARVTNIVQTIENLKKQNIWVIGTDATGEESYFDRDLTGPIALVVGSEGEGMGKLVRESCDFVVNIPMMGQISSLNAAVAGAIVTFEIFRQRSRKQP